MKNTYQYNAIICIAIVSTIVSMLSGCNTGSKSTELKLDSVVSNQTNSIPTVPFVVVHSQRLKTELALPGELEAYQDVPLHAKVQGYISWIGVDRGSIVRKGQPLIIITAPEVDAKVKEAQAKLSASDSAYHEAESAYQSTISRQAEAAAKLDADKLTYKRLNQAAQTPGAIAQNEVDMAQKAVEADKARVDSLCAEIKAAASLITSRKNNVSAARNVVDSLNAMHSYLKVVAPFDGVITERNVHEGSIVAVDSSRTSLPILRIQQKSLLRLVVAVPEESVAALKLGEKIPFSVPAYLGKTFYGTIARLGFALDTKTRTMPVELDVPNANGELEPGMFATVNWSVTRPYDTLFVPQSAVATDLKGTFVVRINNNTCERVQVTRGQHMDDLLEIVGDLKPGDRVALKATNELKPGTHVFAKQSSEAQVLSTSQHTSAGGNE